MFIQNLHVVAVVSIGGAMNVVVSGRGLPSAPLQSHVENERSCKVSYACRAQHMNTKGPRSCTVATYSREDVNLRDSSEARLRARVL